MSATTTVLHVDDDPELLALTSSVLDRDGRFEAITAESASEGLRRLSETSVDCVISDSVRLPDGETFASTVGRDYPDLPVILFTAKSATEVTDELRGGSVTEYVRKAGANDFETLLAHLSRVVGDRAPPDTADDSDETAGETDGTATGGATETTAEWSVAETDTATDPDASSDPPVRVIPDLGPEWTVVGFHDWEDPEELTTSVVAAVAGIADTEMETLPSLYHEVDPEAVADVVCPRSDGSYRHGVQVRFHYIGFECAVTGSGAVAVRDLSADE
ncbi:HalOD1 output domain-containing protein [Salinirubrum litoreum]|uniref:HalOD1 output domain-containing protein n=1 Tax=Salinirubrum litoreum TaxID=1126234 RepID=A0ABD5RET1_9EURY|nr:HalOD1 output domain-containing protein [Salinirubrum litoreum]